MTFHAEGMTRGLTSESIAPAAYAYERPNAGVPETAR